MHKYTINVAQEYSVVFGMTGTIACERKVSLKTTSYIGSVNLWANFAACANELVNAEPT